MTIRHAQAKDSGWLKAHEHHIADGILENKIKNNEIYVVEENGEIIGWLRYGLFWDNVPFMNMLYLLEGYRARGIGTRLVKHWEDEMRQRGYDQVLTSTQSNEEGQNFYRKNGYTEIGGLKFLDDPFEIIFYKSIGQRDASPGEK
jgi:ribosomal protein S18 acetylase RimI-like enzyme